jgi:hypothetical protein
MSHFRAGVLSHCDGISVFVDICGFICSWEIRLHAHAAKPKVGILWRSVNFFMHVDGVITVIGSGTVFSRLPVPPVSRIHLVRRQVRLVGFTNGVV